MPTDGSENSKVDRRLAAILAADIAGYSALMGADEARTVRDLKAHQAVVLPMIGQFGGRIIDTAGDGILAEFGSVVKAVECAVAVQATMGQRNATIEADRQMKFRMGVNLGDIVHDEARVYGDGVNIAARLEAIAEPGGICISGKVYEEISGKLDIICHDLGPQQLKNITASVRVHRIELASSMRVGRQEEKVLALPDRPSIAVLPLANLSRDPEQEYFTDGITEDIITELSRLSELFVIARSSSFQYKGKAVDVRQIGRELGVRYLLEGSIRRAGERVRISTQLIDCATGGHLWAERFDRNLTDIFEVQDEVTRNVVAALAIKLTADAARCLKYEGTDNLEAYDCYLRAREQRSQLTMQSIAQAEVMLKRAIELDPSFGPAYAWLGDGYLLCYINGWGGDADQLLKQALELTTRAVALTPAYPWGHIFLGNAYLWKREHDEALTSIRKSLALAPNLSAGHMWLGWVLHYAGRSEEAIAPINWGLRLDPLFDSIHLHWLAQAYFQLRRYNEAVELLKRRVIRTPNSDISRVLLASAYGHLGRMSEARAEWYEALRINPNYSFEHRRRVAPYKNPADFEHFVEGLHEAGLPE